MRGAINPGKLRLSYRRAAEKIPASMRPGQLTPENPDAAGATVADPTSFNEAGAIRAFFTKFDPLRILSWRGSSSIPGA